MPIKVMIVDDDAEWLNCVTAYITTDPFIAVVAQAQNRTSAYQQYGKHTDIDVVLMDINLHEMYDGIEVMEELLRYRECSFIVITSLQEREAITSAFSTGAINLINKGHIEDITEAIKDAYANKPAIHHSASSILRSEWIRMSHKVSEREIEIMKQIDSGKTIREISEELYLGEQSVKNSLGRLAKRLGYERFNRIIVDRAKKWGWF